jgi:phosphoribosyl 1,2-cyclic phosphodiesterase
MYVAGGGTRILIDAGLGIRETTARLAQLNVPLETIQGVLFTHDHADHCLRVDAWRRRHATPFYANEATAASIEQNVQKTDFAWNIFENGSPFLIGQLRVEPFSVPHDAADAVGFVIAEGGVRLGIATDLGMATILIRRKLAECDALILETNHDVEMLQRSERPWAVIQRIRGRQGHLSNEDAAELLASVLSPRLRTVFLAHLSAACNSPVLAERAVRAVLQQANREDIQLVHTSPDTISARIEIPAP